jgi:hypothetical protein
MGLLRACFSSSTSMPAIRTLCSRGRRCCSRNTPNSRCGGRAIDSLSCSTPSARYVADYVEAHTDAPSMRAIGGRMLRMNAWTIYMNVLTLKMHALKTIPGISQDPAHRKVFDAEFKKTDQSTDELIRYLLLVPFTNSSHAATPSTAATLSSVADPLVNAENIRPFVLRLYGGLRENGNDRFYNHYTSFTTRRSARHTATTMALPGTLAGRAPMSRCMTTVDHPGLSTSRRVTRPI